MGLIKFNGLSSEEFGIKVWSPPNHTIPERDYETIHIPGRNGDLVIDKGSFKNVSRQYVVSLYNKNKDFTALSAVLAEWLHSSSGYARLEDTYEPDYYRKAIYQKATEITNLYEIAAYATIEFSCKPQRFLKSGENSIRASGGSLNITNPTTFSSSPIIKAYGNTGGQISVNGQIIELLAIDGNAVIDCEMMETYRDYNGEAVNWNSYIKLRSNEFPKLNPGSNTIIFSGGISSLEVTPRWWTI